MFEEEKKGTVNNLLKHSNERVCVCGSFVILLEARVPIFFFLLFSFPAPLTLQTFLHAVPSVNALPIDPLTARLQSSSCFCSNKKKESGQHEAYERRGKGAKA